MKAVLIPAQGEPRVVETDGALDDLQLAVGGFIEAVTLSMDAHMYLNEEGKLNGLAYNHTATSLWREVLPMVDDVIVGDAIVLGGDEDEDDAPAWVLARFGLEGADA